MSAVQGRPPDPRRDDVLHLILPVGAPMASLIRAQSTFLELLREVSRSVAGTLEDPVTWVVEKVSESSADLSLVPKPNERAILPEMLHRLRRGDAGRHVQPGHRRWASHVLHRPSARAGLDSGDHHPR